MNKGPRKPEFEECHLWSQPVTENANSAETPQNDPPAISHSPTISDAIATIKKEDFVNVATTPCARQGFLAGIASGVAVGVLKFVLRGNAIKAANWAFGMFILGSTVSYEYCQYQRRAERLELARQIEIVSQRNREQMARKAEADREEKLKLERQQFAAQRPWYRFW